MGEKKCQASSAHSYNNTSNNGNSSKAKTLLTRKHSAPIEIPHELKGYQLITTIKSKDSVTEKKADTALRRWTEKNSWQPDIHKTQEMQCRSSVKQAPNYSVSKPRSSNIESKNTKKIANSHLGS